MVAVQAIDEIADPGKVIQRIYNDDDGRVDGQRIHRLPSAVTRHFSDIFLSASDPRALDQVGIGPPPSLTNLMLIVFVQLPSLDVSHPPESYTRGTLVRFRAMIQDTSLQNEMYLARLNSDRCGGWGIQPTHDDYDLNSIDSDCLGTASIFWAVSVPGESPWRAAEISQLDSSAHALPHRAHQLTSCASKLPCTSVVSATQVPCSRSTSHRCSSQGTTFQFPLRALLMHTRYTTALT